MAHLRWTHYSPWHQGFIWPSQKNYFWALTTGELRELVARIQFLELFDGVKATKPPIVFFYIPKFPKDILVRAAQVPYLGLLG